MTLPLSPQSSVLITDPWWLLALPALAAFLALARLPWWRAARRTGRPALRREGRRLAVRLAWASLLVLALAGATLIRPLHRQATVFVLDASASLADVRDQAEATARLAITRLPDGDLAGVVAAAEGARVEELPTDDPVFTRLAAALPDGASDLAAGLRLAGATLPEGYAGRVVLISDGRQTHGDAVAAARELTARGATVDVIPLGSTGPDLRLDSLDLAETAYRGEVATLTARVAVRSPQPAAPTPATLRVYRDDQLLLERNLELRDGRQEIALPLPVGEPGLHRYRVDLTAADPAADGVVVNNSLGAVQRVVGPPRVLIVAEPATEAGLLPGALEAGGVEIKVAAPDQAPVDLAGWAPYDAVVLADVPAEALPPGTQDLLERYVRDLGRGLVMTGGPDSFGPGGYADTPVERALPVSMDVRGRGREPTVALALVIDKSGSMSGLKMELAKEAAVRSIRLLRANDRAAVLAFDTVPQWVAPLTPLTERARLEQAIGQIYAGGGTEIYPAVAAGFAALRDVEADVKHLIVLTDGRSGSGGEYPALLGQMREARVSLSTVAVGDDADTGLLEAMARAGRGRYHFAADPAAVPQIFTHETQLATRTILVDARFTPAAASGSSLLQGLSSLPPLDGYVAVSPKERAEVVLVSPEGDPVLAAWQYGTGRAIAWTPDLAGRWTSAWAGSPAATLLWGNVLSWLLPPRDTGELAVRVEADGEESFAILVENAGGWEEVRPTRAAVLGPDGHRQDLELAPAGPGRYRARLEARQPGAYLVQAVQTVDGGAELRGETGWVAPYPAEYRETGVNRALLTQVAAAGSGRVLDDPLDALTAGERSAVARWPLWPLLLVLAALGWPIEIAFRRLSVPGVLSRLPLPNRSPSIAASASGPDAKTRRAKPVTPTPAATTTQRLLERKRAFREGQRERTRR